MAVIIQFSCLVMEGYTRVGIIAGGSADLGILIFFMLSSYNSLVRCDGRVHACGDNSRAVRSWSRVRASPLYRGHLMAFLWSIY